MKIPAMPLPATWAHLIHNPFAEEHKDKRAVNIEFNGRIQEDSNAWIERVKMETNRLLGIYMDPPFSPDFTPVQWVSE